LGRFAPCLYLYLSLSLYLYTPPMPPVIRFGAEGAPLHFAHANGFPPLAYSAFLERLARHQRVSAVSLRPLWSDEDPWQTFDDWRIIGRDLLDFLAHEPEPVIGVGHSLGGVATLYAALERPDLFRGIVLVDPVFLDPDILALIAASNIPAEQFPLVAGALRRRTRWESREEAWQGFRERRVFARISDRVLHDYVEASLVPDGKGGYTLAYPNRWEARIYSLPPLGIEAMLPQVQVPTLALRGADSDTLSADTWQRWQTLQPAATFVEMADTGHLLPLEAPARTAAQITEWIRDADRS
jgi:pimeloyl-ACP methyl ester carboxylesterase